MAADQLTEFARQSLPGMAGLRLASTAAIVYHRAAPKLMSWTS
jgi:hypothetical protein